MLRIQRSSNGGVMFTLVGHIEIEHVAELQRLLDLEKKNMRIALDLKEVTLVDRNAVKFLSQCQENSIALENCPSYIRKWIDEDKKRN
jgi:hypothetical protein